MATYLCSKCNKQVNKQPLVAKADWASSEGGSFGGLGTWHCSCSRDKAKVIAVYKKAEE